MRDSGFSLSAEWEQTSEGTIEDRASFAAIGIQVGNTWLSEAEDTFVGRVRQRVHLSAYRLAE